MKNGDTRTTLRVDAERNRVRIVEAAQAAFAEQGLDVSLEAVAERAGVGIATLYRRFPTRDDLDRRLLSISSPTTLVQRKRRSRPRRLVGFAGYIERICEMQAADRVSRTS